MKITVIGSGGCFSPLSIGNSNFLLEENGERFMIDFGMTAPYILRDEMSIPLDTIQNLFCTHVHCDHSGSLSMLAFHRYFVPNSKGEISKPTLYLNQPLVHPLWENSLKGDLESIHGKVTKLEDWFNVHVIHKNKSFTWQGAKFTPFQVTHVPNCFQIKPCYGIMIETKDNCLVISGDSIFSPDTMGYLYDKATIIYQDTEVGPRSKVHANWEDLRLRLPAQTKEKMWGYHYNTIPDDLNGFAGFLVKGQSMEI